MRAKANRARKRGPVTFPDLDFSALPSSPNSFAKKNFKTLSRLFLAVTRHPEVTFLLVHSDGMWGGAGG